MYSDITSAVATDTERDLIHRADAAHQVRLARAARPAGPCAPRSTARAHHLPRLGCKFRTWLAAGYL